MARWIEYLVVGAAAFATVALATPLVARIARRVGAVDRPDARRVHAVTTPTLGGLALAAGLVAAIGVASQFGGFADVFTTTSEPEAILLAALVVVAVGVIDDTRGLSAPAKVAGQVVAAGTLVLFGMRLAYVYVPGSPGSVVALGPELGALASIVAIVAMINAVNLVDGLDGLAAGVVGIAAVGLFAYAQLAEGVTLGLPTSAGLLLVAVIGMCAGFLVHNFHPASIFMGDTGAMLLGLLLGAGSVSAVGGMIEPGRQAFAALSVPVLVPILVLALPLGDTVWTIARRLAAGDAVTGPDKKHLHHRLLALGHSQRRAVGLLYLWSALVAFAAVGIALAPPAVSVAVLVGGTIVAVALVVDSRPDGAAVAAESPAGRPRLVSAFTKSPESRGQTSSDQRKRSAS